MDNANIFNISVIIIVCILQNTGENNIIIYKFTVTNLTFGK